MDRDYKNFVDRMGSSEEVIDLTPIESELKHYGVLGMKWGHRKGVNASTVGAAARTGQSVAALGQTVNRTGTNTKALKTAKKLSDKELKDLASRLELENRYVNATTQQSGRNKVDAILSTAGSLLAVASSAAVLYDTVKKAKV